MLYTSGTTGKPKGVRLTHAAFISAARGGADFDGLSADEDILSYLPMAWVGDHLFSFAQAMVTGFTINCPESAETVMNDLREIGPTYYFAPPRVFENLLTQVMIRMEDASVVKQKMFHFFMAVARRSGAEILDGQPVSLSTACSTRWATYLRLRSAEERSRHEPHPRRLYRRRGDRSGPVPLLSLDRHQPEAALRPDRNLRLRLSAARWPDQVRQRRQAGARESR
jgi:long-subunit acyl-CoA synthetase (AMP-forming)